jgi:hypothetical protein
MTLEGVQMRLKDRRVEPTAKLLLELESRIGGSAIRLTVGEPVGTRSQEIFLVESSS